jgi:hypothetical protein
MTMFGRIRYKENRGCKHCKSDACRSEIPFKGRERNATLNIGEITTCMLRGDPRPRCFTKAYHDEIRRPRRAPPQPLKGTSEDVRARTVGKGEREARVPYGETPNGKRQRENRGIWTVVSGQSYDLFLSLLYDTIPQTRCLLVSCAHKRRGRPLQ